MSLQKKYNIWQPLLLSVMLILGMIIGVKMAPDLYKTSLQSPKRTISDASHKVDEVLKYLESHYVDSISINGFTDQMIQSGMQQLDPHSMYLSPNQVNREESNRQGKFKGIGIDFFQFDDTLIISNIIPGSPADSLGMRPLDKLLAIGGIALTGGVDIQDKSRTIRNEIQNPTTVNWIDESNQKQEKAITSQFIDLSPIENEFSKNQIGYIRVSRFTKGTYNSFMQSLEQLVDSEGIYDLIIDLRDNPGGYMQDAVQLVSQFIPQKGQVLVYTKTKDGRRREYKSSGRNIFQIRKLVILINGNSASASEIVAGVIQDLDRGTIIGSTSFGKGLVQQQFDLTDGSAVYITTERYYTPSGRLIQKPYRYKDDIFSNHIKLDTVQYYTKRGDSVSASGGIIPDIEIEMLQNVSNEVIGYINQYGNLMAYQWIIQNQIEYDSIETIEDLEAIDLITYYAEYAGVLRSQIEDADRMFIKSQLMYNIYKFRNHKEAMDWLINQDEYVQAAFNFLS